VTEAGNIPGSGVAVSVKKRKMLDNQTIRLWQDSDLRPYFMDDGNGKRRLNGNSFPIPLTNQKAFYRWCDDHHNYLKVLFDVYLLLFAKRMLIQESMTCVSYDRSLLYQNLILITNTWQKFVLILTVTS
jgi:hypothetical protein